MYSALVGHDIDSLYLPSSCFLFLLALQVNLPVSLLFNMSPFSSVLFCSSSQLVGVFNPLSLSVWSVSLSSLLAWVHLSSPFERLPWDPDRGKVSFDDVDRNSSWHSWFLSDFSSPSPLPSLSLCLFVCLLFRFNSLVTLLSQINWKILRDGDGYTPAHKRMCGLYKPAAAFFWLAHTQASLFFTSLVGTHP